MWRLFKLCCMNCFSRLSLSTIILLILGGKLGWGIFSFFGSCWIVFILELCKFSLSSVCWSEIVFFYSSSKIISGFSFGVLLGFLAVEGISLDFVRWCFLTGECWVIKALAAVEVLGLVMLRSFGAATLEKMLKLSYLAMLSWALATALLCNPVVECDRVAGWTFAGSIGA